MGSVADRTWWKTMTLAGRIVIRPMDAYLINMSRVANCGRLVTVYGRVGVAALTNGTDGLRLWTVRTLAMHDGGDGTRLTHGGLGYMVHVEE